jgi:hypothetical protein
MLPTTLFRILPGSEACVANFFSKPATYSARLILVLIIHAVLSWKKRWQGRLGDHPLEQRKRHNTTPSQPSFSSFSTAIVHSSEKVIEYRDCSANIINAFVKPHRILTATPHRLHRMRR